MATNLQTTYDSVLGQTKLKLISSYYGRWDIPLARVGRWDSKKIPAAWTVVWSGAQGYEARIADGRGGQHVVARAPRSWVIHAPGCEFHERLSAVEFQREVMFLSFTCTGHMPPLTGRLTTVVVDPEDRLVGMVRSMHHAQERGSQGDGLVAHGMLLAMIGEMLACAHDGGAGTDADPWRLRSLHTQRVDKGLLAAVDLQVSRTLATPPSRDDLAKALGMSVSSLAHRFSAETGLTIIERIRWLAGNPFRSAIS
ncbi:MAG: hypothetical protein AAB263_02635, partial [Planctomycetota bacterium]